MTFTFLRRINGANVYKASEPIRYRGARRTEECSYVRVLLNPLARDGFVIFASDGNGHTLGRGVLCNFNDATSAEDAIERYASTFAPAEPPAPSEMDAVLAALDAADGGAAGTPAERIDALHRRCVAFGDAKQAAEGRHDVEVERWRLAYADLSRRLVVAEQTRDDAVAKLAHEEELREAIAHDRLAAKEEAAHLRRELDEARVVDPARVALALTVLDATEATLRALREALEVRDA